MQRNLTSPVTLKGRFSLDGKLSTGTVGALPRPSAVHALPGSSPATHRTGAPSRPSPVTDLGAGVARGHSAVRRNTGTETVQMIGSTSSEARRGSALGKQMPPSGKADPLPVPLRRSTSMGEGSGGPVQDVLLAARQAVPTTPVRLPSPGTQSPFTDEPSQQRRSSLLIHDSPGFLPPAHARYGARSRSPPIIARSAFIEADVRRQLELEDARRRDTSAARQQLDHVSSTMKDVDDLMARLGDLFDSNSSFARFQAKAAAKIQSLCRMFVTRAKYRRMLAALGRWRARHARQLSQAFDRFTDLADRLAGMMLASSTAQRRRLRALAFNEWANYTRTQIPISRRRVAKAVQLGAESKRSHIRYLLIAWLAHARGDKSRKAFKARHQERLVLARERLELQRASFSKQTGQPPRRVTAEDVREEVARHNIKITRKRIRPVMLKIYFAEWKRNWLDPLLAQYAKYRSYYSQRQQRRIFAAWRLASGASAAGVRLLGQERPVKRRYGAIQNSRRIKNLQFRVLVRTPFKAWKKLALSAAKSNKLKKKKNDYLLRCALRGWQAEGKRSKRVKALVVDKWAAAAREKLSRIFRTWAVFGRTRKARTVRRAVLLKSHKRRRDRRTMYLFFEKWNSVMTLGRISSKHTRLELVQAILEQNKLVELLEASSSEMKKTLDVATETTAAEAKQKDALFERLILAEEQAASLRMALHAAEKEIVTMTAVVDGVLKLHPSTFKQISEEQDFNSSGFRELAKYVSEKHGGASQSSKEALPSSAFWVGASAAAPQSTSLLGPMDSIIGSPAALLSRLSSVSPLLTAALTESSRRPNPRVVARKLALASSVWSHIINESEISTDQRQDLTTLVETGELPVPAEEEQSASVLFPGPSSEGSGTWKELVEDINYAHPRHPKHRPAADGFSALGAIRRDEREKPVDDVYNNKNLLKK